MGQHEHNRFNAKANNKANKTQNHTTLCHHNTEVFMTAHTNTNYANKANHSAIHKETKVFKGLLTQLLHEAFYLEEDSFDLKEDDRVYVEEDESDQFEVIRHLLGSLTPS